MSDSYEDITEEQLDIVLILSNKFLTPLFQFTGLLTNLLNVIIFKELGLNDSMNISFWALSLSDLIYVFCSAVNNVCLIVALSPWQQAINVSLLSLSGWLSCYQYIFLDTSTCTQTYMALARCCCVAMPFKFRNSFTARRAVLVLTLALVVNVVFRIPLVSSHGLSWQTSTLTNTTRFTIWFSNDYAFFMSLEKIAGRTVFPVIFLVATFTCSVILGESLSEASRKRKQMTSRNNVSFKEGKKITNGKEGLKRNKVIEKSHTRDENGNGYDISKSNTLSTKELQVVKAVALVTALKAATLLFICVFALVEASVPEFFPGRKYNRIHATVTAVMNIVLSAQKTGNIFIYYNFNTRFRQAMRYKFCPGFQLP